MSGRQGAQQELAKYSQMLHTRGWVANHDGNASMRLSDDTRFLATPTATSKRLIDAHDLLSVDIEGKKLSGRKRLFSEWHLHATCYKARPDVRVVLHAHCPFSTTLGLMRRSIGEPALPEMVVSLGINIPLLEQAPPKSEAQDRALEYALVDGDADVVLIAGNGLLAVGDDLEQAFLRMELVEHFAQMVLLAAPHGGVTPLAKDLIERLLAARTKAGLGREGRRQA
ncbi:MAG: class II aldolase/adducin family protein [Deltaproteobacteria bacterium]|nr:class II aldolase/adducin family protein [Deltaproteobacteria bacterium]